MARLSIDDTQFVLYDDGENCASVEVVYPGLQSTVQSRCFDRFSTLNTTDTCGWFEVEPEDAIDCHVTLPAVHWGKIVDPDVGYVCVGLQTGEGAEGVTGARFLDRIEGGYILEAVLENEHLRPHMFTPDGQRYGDAPYDAPSEPTYELCQQQAPWGETPTLHEAVVFVTVDDELQTDEFGFAVGAGAGLEFVSGEALVDEEGEYGMGLQVSANSEAMEFAWLDDSQFAGSIRLKWPSEVLKVLHGNPCPEPIILELHISAGPSPSAPTVRSSGC